MKLETILANEEALKSLSELKLSDAQLAWDLSESIDVVQDHIKRFQTKRDEIVKKYGTEDKNDLGRFKVNDVDKFNEEMLKLVNVDVEVAFPSITIDTLNGATVSAEQMSAWKSLKIITKNK